MGLGPEETRCPECGRYDCICDELEEAADSLLMEDEDECDDE